MKSLWIAIALSLSMASWIAPESASAQSCTQGAQHWSTNSAYYYELYDYLCSPAQSDGFLGVLCHQMMTVMFSNDGVESGAAMNATLGILSTTWRMEKQGRHVYTRAVAVPVACVYPAGGSVADGVIVPVHSPRYKQDKPEEQDAAFKRLQSSTSMCLGEGDDAIKVATSAIECGKHSVSISPIDYFGRQLSIYGEGGNDVIKGGAGSDQIFGGSGGDWLVGGSGADMIHAESGNDDIEGASGDDYMTGGAGWDFFMDTGGSLDMHLGGADSDCFSDSRSQSIYGNDGSDIAGAETRAGAAFVSSVEASTGWCIPW